jgi:N-acetylglucosamine-6-phosphate deacetylase
VAGFVDLQVNGVAGVDLRAADGAGWRTVADELRAGGTTAFRPTFITGPDDALMGALEAMPAEDGLPRGPRVLGAHLEGPFLSPARLGAHPAEHRRDPDPALLDRLLAAGRVGQVTLAPELPGGLDLVRSLVSRGIVVSLGHTDADAACAHAAFDAGASTVTHLFNAMRPPTHRDPGVAYVALGRPDVVVQVIADGHHLAGDTVRVAWAAAGTQGRLALVTDAVHLGVPGGDPPRLADGTLAGSSLRMIDAVRNLVDLDVPLAGAVGAATAVPARVARRPDLGTLAVGAPADVVVLDEGLDVVATLVGGR